jgi:predicted nucleic acid-binding protein
MKNILIADTGYLVALANSTDPHHSRSLEVSQQLEGNLVTSWPVITETSYFFLKAGHFRAQLALLNQIENQYIRLWTIPLDSIPRMKTLMKKYQTLPMDLADASLVLLAEELGHGNILSTDRRDFKTYRWKNRKPFKNLLFPDD